MTLYAYSGRSNSGNAVAGMLEAINPAAVAAHLEGVGVTPTQIAARPSNNLDVGLMLERAGFGKPTAMDLILFSRQMLSVTKSGMPLLRGVRSLAASTKNVILRRTLSEVVADLESGRELASAFARHPSVFPDLYLSLVRVGEQTGTLETAFARLAEYLGAQQNLKDRVSGAMRYPLIVIAAIIAAMGVLTVFVIPKFEPMFKTLGDNLPMPTRILLGASNFFQHHWLLAGGLLLSIVAGWRYYVRTPQGKLQWHEWQLKVPLFGRLIKESVLARALGTLSLTLAAGLPMLEALKLIARAAGNEFMTARFEQIRELVQTGEPLSRAAAAANVMPPLVLQMLEVGEETGELTRLLDEIAGYYQREVEYTLQNLTAMIEPILIVVVGGMVLILALGIFLPMWEMLGKMAGT
jgi:MSHA biogenesis protein MshG